MNCSHVSIPSVAYALALVALVTAPANCQIEKSPGTLYVVAAQIDTKVLKEGKEPNSREATLLKKIVEERSIDYYAKVSTTVLTGEKANRENILKALTDLGKKMTKQDAAIVFLAGHGSRHPTTNAYGYHPVGGAIAGEEIRRAFDTVRGRSILLLQSCHANAIVETAQGQDRPFARTLVLTTCTEEEKATRVMGMLMIRGLSAMGANENGVVTSDSLTKQIRRGADIVTKGNQTLHVSRPVGFEDFPLAPKGTLVKE